MAETAAGEGIKGAAKRAVKSSKFSKLKEGAVRVAKRVPVGGVLGPVIGVATTVTRSKAYDPAYVAAATKARKASDKAKATLKKSGQKLSKKDEYALIQQHLQYYLKNPNAKP